MVEGTASYSVEELELVTFLIPRYSNTDGRGVFLTNFKIGYAPSNTLEIYYISKVSWWGESDITFVLGLSAVAATFYLDSATETGWSISGGLGLSSFYAPMEADLPFVRWIWFICRSRLRILESLDCRNGFTLFNSVW